MIRRLHEEDSIPEITRLLHEAYAPLAAMNLRFTATHQDDEVTRTWLRRGLSWVAEVDAEIVATVSLYPNASETGACAWYREPGVFSFGQFAVRPDLQKEGLGTRFIGLLEREAV